MTRVRTPSIPSVLSTSPSVLSMSSSCALEELPFSEFMAKYTKSLPLKVKVCKGFYGVSDETAVTTGDAFNLHFTKSVKVVVVETLPQQGSTEYSIPLNSSIRFSPLYNPHENLEEAKKGYRFQSVAEILAQKVLPKLLRVTRGYTGSNSENSLSESEIVLVLKSMKNKLTGKQLRVFSITANKKKSLSEGCTANFTTAPKHLQLHLYEIVMHLVDAFPIKMLVFLGGEATSGVLNDLQGTVVTLKKTCTETSVIATSALDDDSGEQQEIAELPIDLDIEVEAVALDDTEIDQLRQDTQYMLGSFDPFSVCLYITKATKLLYDIQCELHRAIVTGSEYRGMEVVRPASIGKLTRLSTTSSTSSSTSTAASSQVYQPLNPDEMGQRQCTDYYVMMTPQVSHEPSDTSDQSADSVISEKDHLSLLENHNKNVERKLTKICDDVARLTSSCDHLKRWCESLQNQLRMVHANNRGPSRSISTDGSSPVASPPSSVDNRPPLPTPPTADGEYDVVRDGPRITLEPLSSAGGLMSNEQFLSSLNHQQVQELLEVMGMKQYQEVFKIEQVNGEILTECDDELLASDLGVSSKLHRMRLMKVITGRHSARSILAGEDPYSHKTKQQHSKTAAIPVPISQSS